jgi:hypothetical protein
VRERNWAGIPIPIRGRFWPSHVSWAIGIA